MAAPETPPNISAHGQEEDHVCDLRPPSHPDLRTLACADVLLFNQ